MKKLTLLTMLGVAAGLLFASGCKQEKAANSEGAAAKQASAEKWPDVSHEELLKAIESEEAVVLDVNSESSYQKGHVTGALHFASVKGKLPEVLPEDKDTLIIAYCGGPGCMAWKQAAKAVTDLGYTNVKHYSEGISGWRAHQSHGHEGHSGDQAMLKSGRTQSTLTPVSAKTTDDAPVAAKADGCGSCAMDAKVAAKSDACGHCGKTEKCDDCEHHDTKKSSKSSEPVMMKSHGSCPFN